MKHWIAVRPYHSQYMNLSKLPASWCSWQLFILYSVAVWLDVCIQIPVAITNSTEWFTVSCYTTLGNALTLQYAANSSDLTIVPGSTVAEFWAAASLDETHIPKAGLWLYQMPYLYFWIWLLMVLQDYITVIHSLNYCMYYMCAMYFWLMLHQFSPLYQVFQVVLVFELVWLNILL